MKTFVIRFCRILYLPPPLHDGLASVMTQAYIWLFIPILTRVNIEWVRSFGPFETRSPHIFFFFPGELPSGSLEPSFPPAVSCTYVVPTPQTHRSRLSLPPFPLSQKKFLIKNSSPLPPSTAKLGGSPAVLAPLQKWDGRRKGGIGERGSYGGKEGKHTLL